MEKINKQLLSEKYLLNVSETMNYFGLGENSIRKLLNDPSSNFTVRRGKKLLANRKRLEKYIDNICDNCESI
jgi:hypothetical protein